MEKIILPAFFIIIIFIVDWQDRLENSKPKKDFIKDLELLHPLTEN